MADAVGVEEAAEAIERELGPIDAWVNNAMTTVFAPIAKISAAAFKRVTDNDIHALFVSLCRSISIPARFVMGQVLEVTASDEDSCEVCGYHCWAEFFVAGAGWVPADASCACKYGKHALFGDLELNHVAWSVGRHVMLQRAQTGEQLLYFVAPYAEADGRSVTVQRELTFTAIGASDTNLLSRTALGTPVR